MALCIEPGPCLEGSPSPYKRRLRNNSACSLSNKRLAMAEGVPGAFAQDATLAQEDSTVAPYQPAYAARTCQNRRPYNEDAFCVHLNLLAEAGSSPLQAPLSEVPSPQPCTLMFAGVFDGKRG